MRLRPVDLARAASLHEQSIRKYERWGFLPPAERAPNGYRQYGEIHLAALLCARTLMAGYGWKPALLLMRKVHAGKTADALAEADAIHAAIHRERQEAHGLIRALSLLAGAEEDEPSPKRAGPPGARQGLYVSEVAQEVGVAPSAVRFWEAQGLISPQRDRESRYRLYSREDVVRVQLISTLRKAHYSFEAIRSVLEGLQAGRPELALQAAQRRLEQLSRISQRCAAATAALYGYLKEYGGLADPVESGEMDGVTDWYGQHPAVSPPQQ